MPADREILFGLLALQNGMIGQDMLMAAFQKWMNNKSKPLCEILLQQSSLHDEELQLLSRLVELRINKHQQDVKQSLASVPNVEVTLSQLQRLGDDEINATLSFSRATGPSSDQEETLVHQPCESDQGRRSQGKSRFRILRPHARGGLGEVFVAQDEELKRDVALKEIQPQYANHPESQSRFVLEAEITGGLEHPGIVPVYGLGKYEDGRPYYAMRFIKGDSLKEAIDAFHQRSSPNLGSSENSRLSSVAFESVEFRSLLGRFVDVCQAVAYAHSRGVLHRDLKPGNIMLGKYGETLVVDWGLAKVQGRDESAQALNETTLKPASGSGVTPTVMGHAIGTPAYMPPEQALGKLDELGPASDVYSLGATLYHLLTGSPPFVGKNTAGLLHNVRTGNFTAPRASHPALPKSLEAVCLRAMALTPSERYSSPQALANDIENYLADEPVSAFDEPLSLRVRRWVRKNQTLATTTVTVLVVSALGLGIFSTIMSGKNAELRTINQQLTEANSRERDAKEKAEQKSHEAVAVTNFLVDCFEKTDPNKDGKQLTVYDSLVRGMKTIDQQTDLEPLGKAAILSAISSSFSLLGMPHDAVKAIEQTFEIRKRELEASDPDLWVTQKNLGYCYIESGELSKGLALIEEALTEYTQRFGIDDFGTVNLKASLASAYNSAGKYELAIPLLEEVIKARESKQGPDHLDTLRARNSFALALRGVDRLDEAIQTWEDLATKYIEQFGETHTDTATIRSNLGVGYTSTRQFQKAVDQLEDALATMVPNLGQSNPDVLLAQNNLAMAYYELHNLDNALPLFETTLQAQRKSLGENHPQTLLTKNNLAGCYLAVGKISLAIPLLQDTLAHARIKQGDDHSDTLMMIVNLGYTLLEARQTTEGGELIQEFLARTKAPADAKSDKWLKVKLLAGDALFNHNQFALAAEAYKEVYAGQQARQPDDWSTFATQFKLGASLVYIKKFSDAETPLLAAFSGLESRQEKIPEGSKFYLTLASKLLVDIYRETNRPEEAAKWQSKLDDLSQRYPIPARHTRSATSPPLE